MTSTITDTYAIYLGDCCDVIRGIPDGSIHLSVYSPPFCGLYNYSSSDQDMSNCRNREEFFEHYTFLVRELARVTMPGRISAVHCADIPNGRGALYDLPGAIVALHERCGFRYIARHAVWKEPLGVRMRTMAKGLAHRQVVEDATLCDVASADYLLLFRRDGDNPIPVEHPQGLLEYAGARQIPAELHQYRGWGGHHTENSYSHWIWRQYASAFWDDIRIDREGADLSAKHLETEGATVNHGTARMKKKHPQDATLRNVRASKTRTLTVAAKVTALTARVRRLEKLIGQ